MTQDARSAVLARVRAAVSGLTPEPIPQPLEADARPGLEPGDALILDAFRNRLAASGGEVESFPDLAAFRPWFAGLLAEGSARGWAAGSEVPEEALPPGAPSAPERAAIGLSMARVAAARSGTLVMESRGDRRVQLLPSTHVILVHRAAIFPDLASALAGLELDLPSGLGLHSGPSKSADIGRILVTGVHGPGRLVAAVIGAPP